MVNPIGRTLHGAPDSPYYTPQHTAPTVQPPRYRGRRRSARPYLRILPEPETLVFPAITDDMAPPAPRVPRAVGPWLQHHEHPGPAEDMGELAALCRQLIAQRPDLAHPVHDIPGVRR